MGRIFISHRNTPADNLWAEKIHGWIKDQKGIDGFLDFDIQDGLQAGQRWEDEIYAAMRSAQVVIAIVSNDWLQSHWCTSEARMARLLGLKLILVITEKCEVPFRDTQSIRLEKHGETRAFEELRQALRTTHKLPTRPYPGLAAFDEKDTAVFFGREDETRELVNKVNSLFQGRPKTPRILLVLGASGSGKSSLMRAGFLPEFKADPENLCIGPIIPGGDALDELAEVFDAPLDGLDAEAMADALIASMKGANPSYKRAVICIDQAEELLEQEKKGTFFDVMRRLIEKRRGRVIVLATMRSDFLNEFQTERLIGPDAKLAYETLALDPLPVDHLGAIIRQPADLFGVKYEDELFAEICKDHRGSDALPLLAFFLDEFWRSDFIRDGVLQLSEYKEFGGVGQALEKAKDRAIEECARLDAAYTDRQALLDDIREVFLGLLVSVNESSGAAVRNRAPAAALTERQTALLTAFANQRLLIRKDGTWEVAHEALLRQWKDLESWIAGARDDLVAIARIEAAAANWSEAKRNDSDLTHRGDRLEKAVEMLASPRYAERFDETARAYIEACQARETERHEREQKHIQALEQQKAEAEAAREAAQEQLLAAKIEQARFRGDKAREFLAKGDYDTALALAVTAFPRDEPETWGIIDSASHASAAIWMAKGQERLTALHRVKDFGEVFSAVFSPDGTCILTAVNESVWLWDAETGTETAVLRGHEGRVTSAVFSPDGTHVLTASEDKTARLWDAESGAAITVLRGHEDWVNSAVFSADGTRILTASEDKTARLWDAESGAEITLLRGHEGQVNSAVFSSDGTRILTASNDKTARLWDTESGAEITLLRGHEGRVTSAIFSPDGTRILTASGDETARLWDAKSGAAITVLRGHEDWVNSAVFSADGTRILTASWDQTARLWDAESGAVITLLRGHEGRVTSAVFSPDGTRILTASGDETARLWDAGSGAETAVLRGHEDWVASAVFSPDGTRILTASRDRTARIWDAESCAKAAVLRGHESFVTSAVFSPDGTHVLTASQDKTARLWDAESGAAITVLRGHEDWVNSAVFSADGTRILTASGDRTARLWDAESGAVITLLRGHEGEVNSGVFSSDGTRILTASEDKTARLWDAESGAVITLLRGHEGQVNSAVFSPDGTLILTASRDRTARLWDAESGAAITVLRGHEGFVTSAVFSPDGTRILTASGDETARLWDAESGAAITVLRGHEDWVRSAVFSADGTRILTASWDQTARLWDAESGAETTVLRGNEGRVTTAVFSPDGIRILTASGDKTARILPVISLVSLIQDTWAWNEAVDPLSDERKRTFYIAVGSVRMPERIPLLERPLQPPVAEKGISERETFTSDLPVPPPPSVPAPMLDPFSSSPFSSSNEDPLDWDDLCDDLMPPIEPRVPSVPPNPSPLSDFKMGDDPFAPSPTPPKPPDEEPE